MYHRTRHTRETSMAVTNPSPAALVGSMSAVVLGPVAAAYLATPLSLGGGLLIGIGLSQLLARHNGREASDHPPSNHGRTTEPPAWIEEMDGQRAAAQTNSD